VAITFYQLYFLLFVCLQAPKTSACTYCIAHTILFSLHKSNTDETQTPKQCINNSVAIIQER